MGILSPPPSQIPIKWVDLYRAGGKPEGANCLSAELVLQTTRPSLHCCVSRCVLSKQIQFIRENFFQSAFAWRRGNCSCSSCYYMIIVLVAKIYCDLVSKERFYLRCLWGMGEQQVRESTCFAALVDFLLLMLPIWKHLITLIPPSILLLQHFPTSVLSTRSLFICLT